ncbi:MAG: FeoA family protein [Wenzhouxiangellaceae bacterium]
MDTIPLWTLVKGQHAFIRGFGPTLTDRYRQRLIEMGFHGGERVTCLLRPAFGAPRVYRVSNTVFSLDEEIAAHILMQPEGVSA